MPKAFYIAAQPRSRTAWLSNTLTGKDTFCFHEGIHHNGKIPSREEKYVGTAEVNPFLVPEDSDKIVIIHRDLADVFISCKKHFILPLGMDRREFDKALFKILVESEERLNNLSGLHIPYVDIDEYIYEIWFYLFPDVTPDRDRIEQCKQTNISIIERDLMILGV